MRYKFYLYVASNQNQKQTQIQRPGGYQSGGEWERIGEINERNQEVQTLSYKITC